MHPFEHLDTGRLLRQPVGARARRALLDQPAEHLERALQGEPGGNVEPSLQDGSTSPSASCVPLSSRAITEKVAMSGV